MIDIIQAPAKESGAFKANQPVPCGKPSGLFWHSTGANNPNLNRWAGTSPKQHDLIGENVNKNSFYYSTDVCPHYVLAKGTDKKLHFAQLLPENICCWCSSEGAASTAKKNGFSGNNANFLGYTQIEIGEDDLKDKDYATEVYNAMVWFSTEFFKRHFNGDPNAVTTKTLMNHKEAHKLGIASNHEDTDHWLTKFGFTMDTLRAEVKVALTSAEVKVESAVKVETPAKVESVVKVETPAPVKVETPKPLLKPGDTVMVNNGAKTYEGMTLASWVYKMVYDVLEVKGDRVVIGIGKAVTAAVRVSDLSPLNTETLKECPYTTHLNGSTVIYPTPAITPTTRGTVKVTGIYTIVEEIHGGTGGNVWGRLKSGAGWVVLR